MDKIKIYGIELFAYHGLYEEESRCGQDFVIDAEFIIDTSLCYDSIEKTVHYGDVTLDIIKYATENRFDLLESLANNLSKYLLEKYLLMEELTIIVHKPNAPIPAKFLDVTLSITRKRSVVYLGIGTNLGDKESNYDMVIDGIKEHKHMILVKESGRILTPPYGVVDQPDFLNGALKIKTYLNPLEVLKFCNELEDKAGRQRIRKWGERTLDIDILFYGSEVIYTDDLKIPHPELHIRDFVLGPLCELDPYLIHPIYNKNIMELKAELK